MRVISSPTVEPKATRLCLRWYRRGLLRESQEREEEQERGTDGREEDLHRGLETAARLVSRS